MQRGGEFMTTAMTDQERNPGGSIGNMDIACEADEYVGEDGLVYCSTCHTPRQTRKMLFGKERILSVLCRCRQEERDRLEEERRQRERPDPYGSDHFRRNGYGTAGTYGE